MQAQGLTDVIAVAIGYDHSLALKNDQTVWSWGNNGPQSRHRPKNPGTSLIPMQVKTLEHIIAIAAGERHSAALHSDGSVWTWGANEHGQLGDGTHQVRFVPLKVPDLNNVISITCGAGFTVALRSDGTVWAWGNNISGHASKDSPFPIIVKELSNIKAIDAGVFHALALKNDGTVWSWGANLYGQLGNGSAGWTLTNAYAYTGYQTKGLSDVVAIKAGPYHSLIIKKDGSIWTWGRNQDGELGTGSTEPILQVVPVQIPTLVAAEKDLP